MGRKVKKYSLYNVEWQIGDAIQLIPKEFLKDENGDLPEIKVGEVNWISKTDDEWEEFDRKVEKTKKISLDKLDANERKIFEEKRDEINKKIAEDQILMNKETIDSFVKTFNIEKDKNENYKDWLVGRILKSRKDINEFKGFLVDEMSDIIYIKNDKNEIENVSQNDIYIIASDNYFYYYCAVEDVKKFNNEKKWIRNFLIDEDALENKEIRTKSDKYTKFLIKTNYFDNDLPKNDCYIILLRIYCVPKKTLMKFVNFEGKYFEKSKLKINDQKKVIDNINKIWNDITINGGLNIWIVDERNLVIDVIKNKK